MINSPTKTSFGPLKQVEAGLLNIGYAESGPANGRPVILLHGWPYDIYSFVDVAPLLAAKGYRVIVPYLRGYGTTHFLSNDTALNGQQSVFLGAWAWSIPVALAGVAVLLRYEKQSCLKTGLSLSLKCVRMKRVRQLAGRLLEQFCRKN